MADPDIAAQLADIQARLPAAPVVQPPERDISRGPIGGGITLKPDQVKAWASDMAKQGLNPERVAAAAKVSGYTMVADDKSVELKDFDRSYGAASPDQYDINWRDRAPAGTSTEQLRAADTNVKQWLSAAGFEKSLGSATVETILDLDKRMVGVHPERIKDYMATQNQALLRASGGSQEKVAEKQALARTILEFGSGPFADQLRRNVDLYLSDASIVLALSMHAERILARQDIAGNRK